jgi:LmbE family N-acetylglucosaminyl deacetylase/CheY-like chemotaxis protein
MIEETRLLLVEDDVDQSALVRRWLETAGYSVVHADHGLDGAALASTRDFDAVITDLYLPYGTGFDVVTASKTADRYRPVLVITSDDALQTGVDVMKCRADDCVSKPLKRDALLDKLGRILKRSKSVRERVRTKILAVGAHPDDVEIGCGGALLRHKSEDAEIAILTLTAGSRGGAVSTREREAAAAARQLGANLILGDFEDTNIPAGFAVIHKITEVINDFQPDFLYTHTASDTHQDHVSVHKASLVAARSVPNVMCYQSPSSTIDFRPNRFVDVGSSIDEKLRLIDNYQSQTSKCVYLNDDLIVATARYWGRYAGYAEVEPFEVIRQTK